MSIYSRRVISAGGRIVIAGGSGLIGTALCASYRDAGYPVTRLVRRTPEQPDDVTWDPCAPDPALVDGAEVLINLAGAPLHGHRWTASYRETIRASRVETAHALARMAARAERPPAKFLCASGIRYYGIDRGDELLTERSAPGNGGLLPRVAHEWEAATEPASAAGIAVCHLRLGLVLAREGGLLAALLPMFRLGLGARFGAGREYWSYVTLADAVDAFRFLSKRPDASGPYNVTAPEPVPSREFTAALGRAVRRPTRLRVPLAVLRPGFGGIATEVFGSLRVLPARLTADGFVGRHADVDSAIRAALAGVPRTRLGPRVGPPTGERTGEPFGPPPDPPSGHISGRSLPPGRAPRPGTGTLGSAE